MFQAWRTEDFISNEVHSEAVLDHWEPIVRRLADVRANRDDQQAPSDFWDPLWPSTSAPIINEVPNDDLSDGIALPLFKARAAENPFKPKPQIPRELGLIKDRARWLLSLLDVPNRSARIAYVRKFEELFENFSHPNTFRALAELALNDVAADEIVTAFQLRLLWNLFPKYWSVRPKGFRTPIIPEKGHQMLGWARAARLAALAKGIPAESIIDEDWYYEWLDLPFGDPAYWSFLEYITIRLEAFSIGMLELPRELRRLDEKPWRGMTADISVDGVSLKSPARAAQLVRFETDAWVLRSLEANDVLSPGKV